MPVCTLCSSLSSFQSLQVSYSGFRAYTTQLDSSQHKLVLQRQKNDEHVVPSFQFPGLDAS